MCKVESSTPNSKDVSFDDPRAENAEKEYELHSN